MTSEHLHKLSRTLPDVFRLGVKIVRLVVFVLYLLGLFVHLFFLTY